MKKHDYDWLVLNQDLNKSVYRSIKTLCLNKKIDNLTVGEILATECNRPALKDASAMQSAVKEMAVTFIHVVLRNAHKGDHIIFDDRHMAVKIGKTGSCLTFENGRPDYRDIVEFSRACEGCSDYGIVNLQTERIHHLNIQGAR